MSGPRKLPNIVFPIVATVLALLNFAICLMALNASSAAANMHIWSQVLFIPIAIMHWVNYFRLYIEFRIDTLMQQIPLPLKIEQDSRQDPQP